MRTTTPFGHTGWRRAPQRRPAPCAPIDRGYTLVELILVIAVEGGFLRDVRMHDLGADGAITAAASSC